MKKTALAARLKNAAGQPQPQPQLVATSTRARSTEGLVLIGAHYSPEQRKTMKLIEAHSGKNLKTLLGEAMNHLSTKYGVPETYTEDAR